MARPLTRADVLFRQRLLACSGVYAGKLDGLWGPKTDAAEMAAHRLYFEAKANGRTFDPRTEATLETLQPAAQATMRRLLAALSGQGWTVRATSGTRTYLEQATLYAQGRTAPGKIVTSARAGESNHNFGLAIDIGVFTGSGVYLRGNTAQEIKVYRELGAIGREVDGIEWGGDFRSFPDLPHFQVATGLSTKEARGRFERGERMVRDRGSDGAT